MNAKEGSNIIHFSVISSILLKLRMDPDCKANFIPSALVEISLGSFVLWLFSKSYIIAGGSSRFLQDAVVLPTQYSVGCWEKTWRGHSKLKIKAVQSELMKVGEDSPASTDAFSV